MVLSVGPESVILGTLAIYELKSNVNDRFITFYEYFVDQLSKQNLR